MAVGRAAGKVWHHVKHSGHGVRPVRDAHQGAHKRCTLDGLDGQVPAVDASDGMQRAGEGSTQKATPTKQHTSVQPSAAPPPLCVRRAGQLAHVVVAAFPIQDVVTAFAINLPTSQAAGRMRGGAHAGDRCRATTGGSECEVASSACRGAAGTAAWWHAMGTARQRGCCKPPFAFPAAACALATAAFACACWVLLPQHTQNSKGP